MESPRPRRQFVNISLRVPLALKEQLESEAKDRSLNLNSLANNILARHASFDKIVEHGRPLIVSRNLFAELLERVPIEAAEEVGSAVGSREVKQTFEFLNIQQDLDNLIQHYLVPLGSFAGWYSFNASETGGGGRKLMFEHEYGRKWSNFLKRYLAGMIKSVTGIEPRVTASDTLVTAYC